MLRRAVPAAAGCRKMTTIQPAVGAMRPLALTLLYSRLPPGEREEQLAAALTAEQRGEISFEHLLAAVENGNPVAVVLAVERSGRSAFLWPPVAREGIDPDVSEELLRHLAGRLDAGRTAFTQCVIDPSETAGRERLTRGGFPHETDLLLLSRSATGEAGPEPNESGPGGALISLPFSESLRERFEVVVERSSEGTLDCPILRGIRSAGETLDSHRDTGKFDPARWRLFRAGDSDVGVLLLADHPERNVWEVAYFGVVPEVRGRGYGRRLLQEGIARAQAAGSTAVEVAVDASNRFALRIYEDLGFSPLMRMAVHLRIHPGARETRP